MGICSNLFMKEKIKFINNNAIQFIIYFSGHCNTWARLSDSCS